MQVMVAKDPALRAVRCRGRRPARLLVSGPRWTYRIDQVDFAAMSVN